MLKTTRTYLEGLVTGLQTEKIKFKEGKIWQTNVKTKTIEYNPLDLINKPFLVSKGLLLHELSHVKYTYPKIDTKIENKYPIMQMVYNVFEDYRVEYKTIGDYGDYAKEALSMVNEIGLAQGDQHATINPKKPSKLMQFLNHSMAQSISNRYYLNYDYINNSKARIDEDVLEKVSKIYNMYWDIERLKSTDDLKTFIDKNIYPIIKEYVKNEPNSKKPQPTIQLCYKNRSGARVGGDITPKSRRTDIPTDNELSGLLNPYIRTLASKLGDILQESQATRYTGNYLWGKLLSKNAYKVIIPDTTKIFSRKNTPNKPNYTITFLLDESGSMERQKHYDTYISAFLLHEVCKKLNFKTNTVLFDNSVHIVKQLSDYRQIRGGGTNDLLAFETIKPMLNLLEENIVFVLTDGIGNNPTAITTPLMQKGVIIVGVGIGLDEYSTERLRKHYPHAISVPNTEALPQVMINQLSSIIHR